MLLIMGPDNGIIIFIIELVEVQRHVQLIGFV